MFGYDAQLLDVFPDVHGGTVHATGLENGPTPKAFLATYEAEQHEVRTRLPASLAEIDSIAAWRRVFSRFGVKPTQYRNAAESLLRRLSKAGELPSINLLVDIGNLVSIRYGLPVAVFDLAPVSGRTTVRFADGSERFTDLGSSESLSPAPGEVVFVDDAGEVSARRWCWRQSAQSAAGPTTTEALITVEAHHGAAAEDVGRAVVDLESLLADWLPGASASSAVLTAERPTFGV